MSYSSDTKDLISAQNITTKSIKKSILSSFFKSIGNFEFLESRINYYAIIESASVSRLLFRIIKELYGVKLDINVENYRSSANSRIYNIYLRDCKHILQDCKVITKDESRRINYRISQYIFNSEYLRKGFLKGLFLAIGSLSDPDKSYHLEFVFADRELAEDAIELFKSFSIKSRITKRREQFVLYIKDSDSIIDFLNIVGISKKAFEIENVKVYRQFRNIANRLTNCDTSNLRKTLEASYRHLDAISKIDEVIGLSELPKVLQEMAKIRVDNPDLDLKGLGEIMNPPVAKSTVNQRLKRIEKISNELIVKSEGDYEKD